MSEKSASTRNVTDGSTTSRPLDGATCRNGLAGAGERVEREMDDGRPMKSAVCESEEMRVLGVVHNQLIAFL